MKNLKSIAVALLGEVEYLYSLLEDTIEAAINFYFDDAEIHVKRFAIPEEAFCETRNQYSAEHLLNFLNHQNDLQHYDIVIGLIDRDVYYRNLEYIFGLAATRSRRIIISTYRLKHDPSLMRTINFDVFKERIFKELLHELGHILGLEHCTNILCAMHFSPTLVEVDEKMPMLCNECLKKLEILKEK